MPGEQRENEAEFRGNGERNPSRGAPGLGASRNFPWRDSVLSVRSCMAAPALDSFHPSFPHPQPHPIHIPSSSASSQPCPFPPYLFPDELLAQEFPGLEHVGNVVEGPQLPVLVLPGEGTRVRGFPNPAWIGIAPALSQGPHPIPHPGSGFPSSVNPEGTPG